MKKVFGKFDQDGKATAFYTSDIHDVIPADAVEITIEQWEDLLSDQKEKVFKDGVVKLKVKTQKEKDDELARKEKSQKVSSFNGLVHSDNAVVRILLSTVASLLKSGTLKLSDLSQEEQDLYNQMLDLKGQLY
jgi:hypothetical protein